MATKDYCLSFKGMNDVIVDEKSSQYSNLNLNQNHQGFDFNVGQSKSISNDNKKEKDYGLCNGKNVVKNTVVKKRHFLTAEKGTASSSSFVSDTTSSNSKSQNFSNTWNKSNKTLSSNLLHLQNDYKKEATKQNNSTANNSTLSLHITAYENSVEASGVDSNIDGAENDGAKKMAEKSNLIKKWKNVKQFFGGSSTAATNQFEFPRQQKTAVYQDPEITKFKTSQRLLNINDGRKNGFKNIENSFGKLSIQNDGGCHETTVTNFHSGSLIQKQEIEKYGFSSIAEFKEYFSKKLLKDFSHVKGRRPKFLMVAEKNSLAKDIVCHLSFGEYKTVNYEADGKRVETKPFVFKSEYNALNFDKDEKKDEKMSDAFGNATLKKRDRDNEMPYLTVYEFTCNIFGFEADILMCATNGHLCSEKFEDEKCIANGEEFFSADKKIVKELLVEENNSGNRKFYPKWLRQFATGTDGLILWLDCDDEGEAICFEVIDYVKDFLNMPPNGSVMDVIYRATFYSSSPTQVQKAMATLSRPDLRKNLAMAAKHLLDLIMGKAFTKFQKHVLRYHLPNYQIKDLPFGPCQTAVLKMIVDQCRLTNNYSPKYIVEASILVGDRIIKAKSGEYIDEKTVAKYAGYLKNYKSCELIEEPSQTLQTINPPEGLNSMEFYKIASEVLHIDPATAMRYAEMLYIDGYITYPRTGSTKFPSDLNVMEVLQQITSNFTDPTFEVSSKDFSNNIIESLKRGIEIGNHAPIMPTGKMPTESFKNSEKGKVYLLICKYFCASFMEPYIYIKESVTFSIGGGYKFHSSFNTVTDQGFTELLPWMKVEAEKDESILENFFEGNKFDCLIDYASVPVPHYLNESMLIKKMEEYSIGTDGSVPEHLKSLQECSYVKIDPFGRYYVPTELGVKLIEAYEKCIPDIIDPKYRAKFIKEINEITTGDASLDEVFDKYLNRFLNDFKKFSGSFDNKIADHFEGCFKLKERPPPPEPINNNPKLKILLQ